MNPENIRNIAIIAHVDHGKTTLLDVLFRQTDLTNSKLMNQERIMDSNPLEKERGITILAKNASLEYKGVKINVVDTPGHADFGGEVERILNMVEGVLILVDAYEGPMPQTKFVTKKALSLGLHPLVVVNKIDRNGAEPDKALDAVFNLFVDCGATDAQLDFAHVYASAKEGYAIMNLTDPKENIIPLLDLILKVIPPPLSDVEGPFQMVVTDIHYDTFIGQLLVGKIKRGTLKKGDTISRIDANGEIKNSKVQKLFGFKGLVREEITEAYAGDITLIAGIEDTKIGDTLANPQNPEALPTIRIEEPTITMNFKVNDGPFAGKEGKYVTSRQLRDRLYKEKLSNVSLKVEDTDRTEEFRVSGRGELHLGILIETMRREGFEFCVSRPEVFFKIIDGVKSEPIEDLQIEIPENSLNAVMDELGKRKAEILEIIPQQNGTRMLKATIPTRGLIGFRSLFLTLTKGEGILTHSLLEYQPYKGKTSSRTNGVLISHQTGESIPYAIFNLQERGVFIIPANVPIYEGMIVGIHNRDNDLTINVCMTKKLTNVRAAGKDDAVKLTPYHKLSLEQSLDFIEEDELVEVTPKSIRLRKRNLKENERKRGPRKD